MTVRALNILTIEKLFAGQKSPALGQRERVPGGAARCRYAGDRDVEGAPLPSVQGGYGLTAGVSIAMPRARQAR